MQLTLYRMYYSVSNSPICYYFFPFPPDQVHTFTRKGKEYKGVRGEEQVTVPQDSKVDEWRNRLAWGKKRLMRSSAKEVHEFAEAGVSGFCFSMERSRKKKR